MENVIVNNQDITSHVTSFETFEEMEKDHLIGNTVSTQIKLSLKNKDNLLNNLLGYPFIIGTKEYIVYEKPEKWTKVVKLTLYDKMILLNKAYDTKITYPSTVSAQLDEISKLSGIEIDKTTLSEEVLNKAVNWYDNTVIMRNYIGFIAECDGKNAFIKDNKLVFRALGVENHKIDFCSNYELNELLIFTRACFDDGVQLLQNGTNDGKTIYLSSNNSYVTQEDVDRVALMYKSLSFYSFKKFKSHFNCTLTDLITYDNITILPLSSKSIAYGGEAKDSVEMTCDISLKNTDTVIVKDNPLLRIKRIQTIVDQNNARLDLIAQNVENQEELLKNSISVYLVLNYIGTQTKDEALNKFYPDYEVSPLKITATVKDTLKNVYTQATVSWKRKGQNDEEYVDLIAGEVATNNVLTISHNLNESVEYIAYASVTTSDHKVLTAENTVKINFDLLKKTEVDGSMCSIVTTTNDFIFSENDYEPNNIVLTPQLFGCNFDSYAYSTDLGLNYVTIEVGGSIEEVAEGEEPITPHMFNTNVVGIQFNDDTKELIVQSNAACFELTNVVVFKLKTDVLGYENTTTLTKTTDVNNQLNNIKNEINALVETNKNLSLTLDGLNNSINSKVSNIEKTITDDMTEIKQTLSNVIQTSDSIEEQFKVLKEIIDENGSELQTITTYIRKTAKGIEVGELDANVKTLMGTSYFAILFNDEEKMKLEQNLLTIENIKALMGFQLGNSIFSVKSYGFDITWGGD